MFVHLFICLHGLIVSNVESMKINVHKKEDFHVY